MGAVRAGEADVLDERDLFQHVFGLFALVQPAVDDRQRERVAMLEQEHGGHAEQAVDGAGDARKLGARVMRFLERDGEEEVGLHRRAVVFAFAVEEQLLVAASGGADFVVRDLKKEVHGLPVGDQGVLRVERAALGEGGEEVRRGVRDQSESFLAAVAQ